MQQKEFEVKTITSNNICLPDENSKRSISEDKINDFLTRISNATLNNSVPSEVKNMFKVTRGTMVYGYFFYPLFALASEQLFRILESAIDFKCRALGAPKRKTKCFKDKVDWLCNQNVISEKDEWW